MRITAGEQKRVAVEGQDEHTLSFISGLFQTSGGNDLNSVGYLVIKQLNTAPNKVLQTLLIPSSLCSTLVILIRSSIRSLKQEESDMRKLQPVPGREVKVILSHVSNSIRLPLPLC